MKIWMVSFVVIGCVLGISFAFRCSNESLIHEGHITAMFYDPSNTLAFKRLQSEHCLYIYHKDEEVCLISLYVDDLIIAGTNKLVTDTAQIMLGSINAQ